MLSVAIKLVMLSVIVLTNKLFSSVPSQLFEKKWNNEKGTWQNHFFPPKSLLDVVLPFQMTETPALVGGCGVLNPPPPPLSH
jgi:hypothetical protein